MVSIRQQDFFLWLSFQMQLIGKTSANGLINGGLCKRFGLEIPLLCSSLGLMYELSCYNEIQ